jgi:PhnB protein
MSTTPSFPVVQSYLNLNGRCEEALEFYKKALGAEVEMILRFKDNPDKDKQSGQEGCGPAPTDENKVMHSSFRVGATTVMASDCECTGDPKFQGFSLALSVLTEAEADKYFNALSEGGKVTMPLSKTFWSPKFGMVADRFGIHWMIMVCQPQ